jgi:uncharacterized coiled-coil protein SlyX
VNARIGHWMQNLGALEARIAALETKVAQTEQAATRIDSMAHCIINLTAQVSALERKLQLVQEAQEKQAARVLQVPQTQLKRQVASSPLLLLCYMLRQARLGIQVV